MTQVLNNVNYAPVGRCIYCLTTDNLTKEHIMPFGLDGTAILPKSSCKACATQTGRVEQFVQRELTMWHARVWRELKSRTNHADAPQTGVLQVTDKAGNTREVELPHSEFPHLLALPRFTPPDVLEPRGHIQGITFTGTDLISYAIRPDEAMKDMGVLTSTWSAKLYPTYFARMIAKVAYSYAVATGRWSLNFGVPAVVPSIIGVEDRVGRWVGTMARPNEPHPGLLHRLDIIPTGWPDEMLVEIQLFADWETPSYGVVLEPMVTDPKS